MWIGTNGGGVTKFDWTNWIVYDTSNSGLPNNSVSSITIDGKGDKWIGTYFGGLTKFDGTNWTVYKTSNSGLPRNNVRTITIDGIGNKWIGTYGGGLAVYREGGVILDVNVQRGENMPIRFNLKQNYPNPFNPTTIINYSVPKQSNVTLIIYDALGREITMLINEEKAAGNYTKEFNAVNLSSGIYFYQIRAGAFIQTKKMLLLR